MTNLEWALKYTTIGWHVFPIWWIENGTCACGKCIDQQKMGKHPITPRGHNDATLIENTIKRWWSQYPKANIGVKCGKESGISVLDIDERHGGFKSISLFDPPVTVEAKSGSGSKHLFYKYNSLVKSVGSELAPGLDTKSDGGYIIVEPSNHWTGGNYEWITDQSPFEYPLAECPKWMEANKKQNESSISTPAIIPAGQRNQVLCSIAGTMHRRHLSKKSILTCLLNHNKEFCNPPLSDDEVASIVNSVGKYDRPSLNIASGTQIFCDSFNSELLVNLYKNKLIWCSSLGGWLYWNGLNWEKAEKEEPMSAAVTTFQKLVEMIQSVDNKRFTSHATNAGNYNKLNAMLNISKMHLAKRSEEFDSDENLFNCLNGTINLQDTSFNAHNVNDYITKLASVNFDANANCQTWTSFIFDIFKGDKELIEFVQKSIGYSLSGEVSEQCMFICYGTGKNGKSTFLETLREIFGDYGGHIRADAFMEKRGSSIPNDIAAIRGKRYVTIVESEANKKLDETMIKQVTGNEAIQARFLNKEFFVFRPTFKIWMATNHKPRIDGTDDGVWRRIRLIPFLYTVPSDKLDKNLMDKLINERSGIMNWALLGYQKWRRDGLIPPKAVTDFTDQYREDEDIIGEFITDKCLIDSNLKVEKRLFKVQLEMWAGRKFSDRTIKEYMIDKSKYNIKMHTTNEGRPRFYEGLSFRFSALHSAQLNVGWNE